MSVLKNIVGQKFHRLTVLKRAENRIKSVYWLCVCDCGTRKEISSSGLLNDTTKSCGCLAREASRANGKKVGNLSKKKKHGLVETPEYNTWLNIKSRCYRKTATGYDLYGGRGIYMDKNWKESFLSFYRDMGPRPTDKHSIDRIDNNGNYEPGNCRWATTKEQALNKRSNTYIEFRGEKKSITQWSFALINGRENTVRERLNRGWNIEDALTKPCKTIK